MIQVLIDNNYYKFSCQAKIRLCQDECSEGLKTSLADMHSIARVSMRLHSIWPCLYSHKLVFSAVSSLKRFKVRRILEFLTHSQEHINIDVLALNLNVQCQMMFTANTYSWPVLKKFRKHQEEGSLQKNNLHVGCESFLKKTMSEKSCR